MNHYSLCKQLFEKIGVKAYRLASLPRNLDFFHDLKRIRGIKPEMVFDVGANVGQFAKACRSAFPEAFIHSFEPVSSTYKSLTLSLNGQPRSKCHHIALGAEPGTDTIYLRSNSVWNSMTPFNNDPSNSAGQSEVITISTIDLFCQENQIFHIDLLKTDTEGFDAKVLTGASRMLIERRIKAVYTEVTFLEHDLTHTQFSEIFSVLSLHGFILYGIYEFAGDFDTMHANALFVRDPKSFI